MFFPSICSFLAVCSFFFFGCVCFFLCNISLICCLYDVFLAGLLGTVQKTSLSEEVWSSENWMQVKFRSYKMNTAMSV
jgi:hypothetical protein